MAHVSDIVIIGGGVIGLACAYRLAQSGLTVTILDDQRPGCASVVAAGMLAPLAESNALPALAELGYPSLRSYPNFLAELVERGGSVVPLMGPGILRIATTDDEARELCVNLDRQQDSGFPVHLIDHSSLRELEPALIPHVLAAVLSPAEKHLQPTVLMDSLRQACVHGGAKHIRATVDRIEQVGSGWTVHYGTETLSCQKVVACGGVWTGGFLQSLGYDIPIEPLKGQILLVRGGADNALSHTVYAHSTYIVPRPDREILLGATQEPEAMFDTTTTESAAAQLRANAAEIVPALADALAIRPGAGLRPATPDRLPIIGKLPGHENLYIAAGHGRNGILLTPITADIVRGMIVEGVTPPASIAPGRFL